LPRIVIIAGEASGDQLGRGLIEALRVRYPNAIFEGITGPQMRAAGCRSWGDYQQLAVMGLTEVIRHLPRLRRLKRELEHRLASDPPDLLVGIDAPDFNLRIEKFARSVGIPTAHYVCPSVWAWRQGRVKTIRAACDLVLCLLPFEQEFIAKHGIQAAFVGHPLADEIGADDQSKAAARAALGLDDRPVLALLPGSRAGEIERLGGVFLEAAQRVRHALPGLQVLSPAASPETRAQFQAMADAAGLGDAMRLVDGRSRLVLAAADTVLVASGTATLEAMLLLKPMVVAYRVAPLSAWFARVMRLLKIKHFALPNLLAGYELVPEFIQEDVTAAALSQAVLSLMRSTDQTDQLITHFRDISQVLRQSASQKAAEAVAELLEDRAAGKEV
jgi:lipid-A-disaccharide synthase